MRFELIGYGPLPNEIDEDYEQDNSCLPDRGVPLGMENGDIPDESLAASTYGQSNHAPWLARLHLDTAYGWIPTLEDENPFLEVDLQTKHLVTGVITQGHRDLQWWTTSTWLEFFDGQFWKYIYEDDCGSRTIFPTNYDNNSPVTILLPAPVIATKVRIYPQSWSTRTTLRCEILGREITNMTDS
ncbi:retinoschisin-like [Lytechinus variegatus]|uniref:retinoschisin-like n=1 Tax=Lytechinus variegatus TaxID=7654 RepID=UPI001BB1C70C|nr:retinoschisin-like [Lytechinus variegatus]